MQIKVTCPCGAFFTFTEMFGSYERHGVHCPNCNETLDSNVVKSIILSVTEFNVARNKLNSETTPDHKYSIEIIE